MKKVISIVAALALAAVMATSAFAASSEELKGYAAEYYNTYNGKSYGVSLDAVYSAIDALPNPEAVKAAASTAGVIKATGLNTTGAAVVALAVASVLGAAAVKARKLGE